MKPFIGLFLAASIGAAAPAFASGSDFHVGTFHGTWCNYQATFDVERWEPGGWTFYGRIRIEATGEYDPIQIDQFDDQHLRIIRYLQGDHRGQRQIVTTGVPYRRLVDRDRHEVYVVFPSGHGFGHGCEGTNSELWMWES